MSVDIRGTFFHQLSWPAQVAKWLETVGTDSIGARFESRTRTKLSGGPEHWLGTALVPPFIIPLLSLDIIGAVVYDIGWGQKLLLHCTGSGLPTVVLEAPIGQASYVWSRVQPILAKQTRVKTSNTYIGTRTVPELGRPSVATHFEQ